MKKLHYSWIILIVAFFAIIVAGIIRSSSGVFIEPFEKEFNWSRPMISFAFAVGLFLYGFSGPFMAAFVERFGLKRVMLYSMALLAIGLSLTFIMNSSWQLILIWGVMIGIGSGLFLTVLSTQVANRWFVKRRGLAVGILTAATATGQLVLLPVLAALVEYYSWRYAIGLILALSVIMLLLILIFIKEWPRDIQTTALGLTALSQAAQPTDAKPSGNPFKMVWDSLLEGIKSKTFWLLAGSFFICGLSTTGLVGTHFIGYCMSFGIPMVFAASLLSFMGIFDLIGTTLSGWLSDRFDNRWLLFIYYAFRGLSLIFLPFALQHGSVTLLVIFAIFYGLDWIATVPPTIGLTRREFGIEKSAMMYGWMVAFHQVGAAVATFGGGLLYNAFDSYTSAFVLAGIFCGLGSLFVILLRKHNPREDSIGT
ncbi:MAG: MFS transporter [Candidatus Kurthia intestinigallinarum]|uniref:MFS transporter n=1 Tax=Kurthia sp. Dielmo TaxID=1033738 RepID=UPI00111E5828|nr:MFS transporter [Kurthia sp. Dielmo]